MPEVSDPQRRLVVAVDMESYSQRSNPLQYRAQHDLRVVMDSAAEELGLDRPAWLRQQTGDGELAILPLGASERKLIAGLPVTLDRLLRQYNAGRSADGQIRLRIAADQGLVHVDGPNGNPGEAVVTVCRLLDADVLKETLKKRFPRAATALILSDQLYAEVVKHYQDLRPDLFRKVRAVVTGKGFARTAWIYVPHENAGAPIPTGEANRRRRSSAAAASQTFQDIHTSGPASFGNGNTMNVGDDPWRS